MRVSQVGSLWVSGWEGRVRSLDRCMIGFVFFFVSSLVAGDLLLFLMLNLVRSLIDMRSHLISRIWNPPVSASISFKMMEYSSQQILSLYQID